MGPDAPRTAVFGTRHRAVRNRVEAGLRARVRLLRADVGDALGPHLDDLVPNDPAAEFSAEAVSALSRLCVARLAILLTVEPSAAQPLLLLALDLQQLALELHQEELSLRNQRLSDCADGLSRLRILPSSHDLMEAVCEELLKQAGFGRAVLSRVENGCWIPMIAHFAAADANWFSDFAEQAISLDGRSPEARMLTERLPAVVPDTAQDAIHKEIIVDSGQSASYVIAPLMAAGSVVGLLHADHFPSSHRADETDRDVLWAFATGFNLIHERMVLEERIAAQRTKVEDVLGSTLRRMGDPRESGAARSGLALVAAQSEALSELTTRETEVLHLIVEGSTNQLIATRLTISQDTVKSHVKQILRKLGVSNRAQVIAAAAGTAFD
jgi:DNA-binding CsgD family transcriptional regulator